MERWARSADEGLGDAWEENAKEQVMGGEDAGSRGSVDKGGQGWEGSERVRCLGEPVLGWEEW